MKWSPRRDSDPEKIAPKAIAYASSATRGDVSLGWTQGSRGTAPLSLFLWLQFGQLVVLLP